MAKAFPKVNWDPIVRSYGPIKKKKNYGSYHPFRNVFRNEFDTEDKSLPPELKALCRKI